MTYNLVLAAKGFPVVETPVETFQEASTRFQHWRDRHNLGASDMNAAAGNIFQGITLIARVSYNGKIWPPEPWTPNQKPLMEASKI